MAVFSNNFYYLLLFSCFIAYNLFKYCCTHWNKLSIISRFKVENSDEEEYVVGRKFYYYFSFLSILDFPQGIAPARKIL